MEGFTAARLFASAGSLIDRSRDSCSPNWVWRPFCLRIATSLPTIVTAVWVLQAMEEEDVATQAEQARACEGSKHFRMTQGIFQECLKSCLWDPKWGN